VPNLVVSSLTPNSGPVGTQVTIAGAAFGATQGTSVLTFNGQVASPISWSDTQISANVPVTAASGPAVVTVNGINSNATVVFTVPAPYVSSFTPSGGTSGTQVTVHGTGFQPIQRDSRLTFNGTPATVTSWSDTQIVATVPTGSTTGPMLVTVNSVSSPSYNVFEVPRPVITALSSPEAPAGGRITISGSGFGASDKYSPDGVSTTYVGFVNFNGITAGAASWSDTSITANVPWNATTGPITVLKYNATSNPVSLTVEGAPTVTSISLLNEILDAEPKSKLYVYGQGEGGPFSSGPK
jgi:IPT/TIG domain-containing protein